MEGCALEPATGFAAVVFALSAFIGAVTVIVVSWRLMRRDRQSKSRICDWL